MAVTIAGKLARGLVAIAALGTGHVASANDAAIGALIGAGAGAIVGQEMGGQEAAVAGGVIGAVTGAAFGSHRSPAVAVRGGRVFHFRKLIVLKFYAAQPPQFMARTPSTA